MTFSNLKMSKQSFGADIFEVIQATQMKTMCQKWEIQM